MTLLGTAIARGTLAARPASASAGRLYFDTTNSIMYRDNGSSWDSVEGAGGLADPMTTRGDVIVRNASNVTARLAIGSTGKVLQSDGTDISWQTPAGGGGALVFLAAQTASASAQLDFTSFISSTYDEYMIELINLVPATNDVALRMRMGTGGGPTFDTGANYGWGIFIARAGGSATTGGETGQTFIGLNYGAGGTLGVSSSTNYGLCGHARLFSPQSTALYKIIEGDTSYLDAEPFRIRAIVTGSYQSTTAVTAVQFYFSSGNIASGTIRVYGIAKS
ncbi:MAG: hypothetical protein ABIW84_07510 [Ilumatobacteraceae bacterium]